MPLFDELKKIVRPLFDKNVYLQNLGFNLFKSQKWLLPHDTDFKALPFLWKDGDQGIFLDIGANIGLSVLSCRKLLPGIPIFAIEPNPENEIHLRNIAKKDGNFKFKMSAVSDRNEVLTLFIPELEGLSLHTMASTSLDALMQSMVGDSVPTKIASKGFIRKIQVNSIKIDDLNIYPAIVKIDVEGYESHVVKGAETTIDKYRPYFLSEINEISYSEMSSFLGKKNYSKLFYCSKRNCLTEDFSCNRNVYFVPNEKMNSALITI